ncbi:MAG TPA: hypothetical protein VNU70_12265, partial [Puia sp.]|nr:hypothetical protein [Puia sp.]
MKAIQTKTKASSEAARKSGPFFKKGPGQGFFKPSDHGIQRKLAVGEPHDAYEKEADHMADRVVKDLPTGSMSEASQEGKSAGVRRKPIFESKNDPGEG